MTDRDGAWTDRDGAWTDRDGPRMGDGRAAEQATLALGLAPG